MKLQVLLLLSLQHHNEASQWSVTFDDAKPTAFYRSRITTEVSRSNESKKNRRYSKKNRKPFIPPPPPPFLFNSAAEQYLGEDRFRQLKKEYMERYIGALDKAKQIEDLYEPYGSSSFDPESGTESTPTKSYENTDHYNAFVTSVTASRKKTTPLIVYKPFESRPTAGVYPAYSSTPLTSITTMTSSTRTSSITTSKPSTTQSTITKKTRMQVPKNDTIQASDKESSASQLIGNALFILSIICAIAL